jgi:hypothetical protein
MVSFRFFPEGIVTRHLVERKQLLPTTGNIQKPTSEKQVELEFLRLGNRRKFCLPFDYYEKLLPRRGFRRNCYVALDNTLLKNAEA